MWIQNESGVIAQGREIEMAYVSGLLRWSTPLSLCTWFCSVRCRLWGCSGWGFSLRLRWATSLALSRRFTISSFLILLLLETFQHMQKWENEICTFGGRPRFLLALASVVAVADVPPDFLFLLPLGRPRPLLGGLTSAAPA
jgi:hypothetical protein